MIGLRPAEGGRIDDRNVAAASMGDELGEWQPLERDRPKPPTLGDAAREGAGAEASE